MSRAICLYNFTRTAIGARTFCKVRASGYPNFSPSTKLVQNASQTLSTILQSKITQNHLPMISPARDFSSETVSLQPTVDYDELKFLLENDEILLIDVRNPEELEEDGEIDEAMSVPLPELKSALALSPEQLYGEYGLHHHGLLSPSTPIVFSCLLGKRSGMACNIALEAGYTNVSNYTGGWRDWSQRH